jgi:hypothetical protein
MVYSGKNKEAAELEPGDLISVTGYSADASEVESVEPIGDRVIVRTANDKSATWLPNRIVRLYV